MVLDFITELLAAPDRLDYEPYIPTREQADFTLRLYEINPLSGKRVVRRAVLSRPRGWGKSPFVGALGICEALADVVPDGWDANGQPVGKPWVTVRTPYVRYVGVSEEQTKNAWDPMKEMLRDEAPIYDAFPGLEALDTVVNLPFRGNIARLTSSASTVKGGKPVAVFLDQTEVMYPGNGGVRLAKTLRNNAAKIGGLVVETPNAYTPGDRSVAESTAKAQSDAQYARDKAIERGETPRYDRGILYDHREAPALTEIFERESVIAGLRYAYGDSSDHPDGCVIHDPPCKPGWSPIEGLVATMWDEDADIQLSKSDFLNQVTNAQDAYMSSPIWGGAKDLGKVLRDRDLITMGFDGSRGKSKGKPDATALVACRVSDGHIFELEVWEADDVPSTWATWEPPMAEIEAKIADCFKRYRIARFYCDPARDWRSHVNTWESLYVTRLTQKSTVQHPFEWWMTGGRSILVERAVEDFYSAISHRDISHDNSFKLTQHILNARRRIEHGHLTIAKESSYSQKKIDAAVAAILAYKARSDAIAGEKPADKKNHVYAPRRLR